MHCKLELKSPQKTNEDNINVRQFTYQYVKIYLFMENDHDKPKQNVFNESNVSII